MSKNKTVHFEIPSSDFKKAMLKMKKIDIETLKKAYEGKVS